MITFIATAYNERNEINVFLNSLLTQTNKNWKCVVYSDTDNEFIRNVINNLNDDRVSYKSSETQQGYWGHYSRIDALNNLVDTDYVVQTSVQDYYTPNFVQDIENVINQYKADFIYFDCVHNHFNYDVLRTELRRTRIDWGCFVMKTSKAKNVGINHPKSEHCDGIFVEESIRKYPNMRVVKINKVLTVHN